MIVETECQTLFIDAVKDGHGYGIKLNNRFLVGYVDLFLKLPEHEPCFLEAKRTVRATDGVIELDVTTPQKNFLKAWNDVGMLTGTVSFVIPPNGTIAHLRMRCYNYGQMIKSNWQVNTADHVELGGKHERFDRIRQELIRFYAEAGGY